MAASGSIRANVTNNGHIYLLLSWSTASQSAEENYSLLNWNLKLVSAGYGAHISSSAGKSCSVSFNGSTVYSGTVNIGLSAGASKVLASGSNLKIPHNGDGSKSFSYSFSQQIHITYDGIYIGTKSASGTGSLPSIPRASTISGATGSVIGSPVTVHIQAADSSFRHDVFYTFESKPEIQIGTKVEDSCTFTIPPEDCIYIPNKSGGNLLLRVDTYSGSVKIGTSTRTINQWIDTSYMVPSAGTLTASRIDGTVPADWGVYVQGKSKAALTISGAEGYIGSTIQRYAISGSGFSGNADTLETGYLSKSGSIPFTGTVTDSRGVSGSCSHTIQVEPYASPVIKGGTADRCEANGTLQDDGESVKITAEIDYSAVAGHNTVSRSYQYRKTGDSTWSSAVFSTVGGADIVSGRQGDPISSDSCYEIKLTVRDAFESTSFEFAVPTAKVIMDYKQGGTGMAIGKVSELDGLEIDWPVYIRNTVSTVDENGTVSPFISTGTWTPVLIAYGGGTAPTVSYLYQNGVYYRVGDLVMLTFRLRGAVTNTGSGYAGVGGIPIPAYNTNMGYLPVTLGSCARLVADSSSTIAHTGFMSMGQNPQIIIRDAAGQTALKYVTSTTDYYFELSGSIVYIAAPSE